MLRFALYSLAIILPLNAFGDTLFTDEASWRAAVAPLYQEQTVNSSFNPRNWPTGFGIMAGSHSELGAFGSDGLIDTLGPAFDSPQTTWYETHPTYGFGAYFTSTLGHLFVDGLQLQDGWNGVVFDSAQTTWSFTTDLAALRYFADSPLLAIDPPPVGATATPEPGTMALLGLGGIVAGLVRRRR